MVKAKTEINWRVASEFGLAVCLTGFSMLAVSPAKAQAVSVSQESIPSFRLLSPVEGRLIADAARDQDLQDDDAQDCSHLVHQAYVSAGFEYPYANSFDLYAGNENFARIKHPRTGDLIVWLGHVGIVLDPREHSFYSLVSTGLEAQDYESDYWKSRGRPRFYRYKVENSESLTASRVANTRRASQVAKRQETGSLIEERSEAASSSPNRPPQAVSARTKVANISPASRAPIAEDVAIEVPQSIGIASGMKQPTTKQVADGISELTNASGGLLRASDPARSAMPVVIFEGLRVQRLEIKKDHGWAQLQVDSRVTITGGTTELKRRSEKVRWELQRTESGWEAVTPADRTYVPMDVAVRNLAARLAELTAGNDAGVSQEVVQRQESRIAKLLSVLLEN